MIKTHADGFLLNKLKGSFFSGFICECGVRGAYVEMENLDPAVSSVLVASIAAKLCPTILGQVC